MRTIRKCLFAATALACLATGAQAADKKIGSWTVSVEKDKFSGDSKIIAMRMQKGWALGLRCFSGEPSIVVVDAGYGEGRFSEGMPVEVKFRADEKPIVETFGLGLNDSAIQIGSAEKILDQIKGAKEYAFRITYKTTTFDVNFTSGKGAAQVISEIEKSCPPGSSEDDKSAN